MKNITNIKIKRAVKSIKEETNMTDKKIQLAVLIHLTGSAKQARELIN